MAKNKRFVRFLENFKAQKAESGDVMIEGWANKAVVDDVGDLMKFDNVDMGRFEKNPILLYNHNRDCPVGKVIETKLSDEGLWVKAVLSNSTDKVVSYVRDLVAEGILKTFSIGFDPKQEQMNRQAGYNEISAWRLNEISIVTLPANTDAEFSLAKSLESAEDYAAAKALVMQAQKEAEEKKEPPKDPEKDPPKDPEEDSEEDAAKKAADAFKTCVSEKIPKLVAEGKPQDQAVAVAMSMCREEGKCAIDMMSKEMFDHANAVASSCIEEEKKKNEDAEKSAAEGETKANESPTVPVSQPSDDPTNFGSPYMAVMQSSLALLGKISTQLASIAEMLAKDTQVEENTETETVPPNGGEESAKSLEKMAEIQDRISAIYKELGI